MQREIVTGGKDPKAKYWSQTNLELIAISRSPSCRRPAYPEATFLHRASIDAQQVLTWPFPVVSARKRRQILASSSAWQLSLLTMMMAPLIANLVLSLIACRDRAICALVSRGLKKRGGRIFAERSQFSSGKSVRLRRPGRTKMLVLLVWRQNSISLAAVFPDNDNCAIANGQSGTEQLGTFSVSGEEKGIVPPTTGSPTLTGRASARYNRAVRELIAIRAGLGAKGAPRVGCSRNPQFPVSVNRYNARAA